MTNLKHTTNFSIDFDDEKLQKTASRLGQLTKDYDTKPFPTTDLYNEFAYLYMEHNHTISVMRYTIEREKIKLNTSRIEKGLELSEEHREKNWKDITQAQLDRDLDTYFIKEIEKIKLTNAYCQMHETNLSGLRTFMDSLKTDLIFQMSENKQNEFAQNNL